MSQEGQRNKMKENALLVESSRCIGCCSCEVACKMEHDLPAGPRPIKVIQLGPVEQGDELIMSFQFTTCFHCDRPACVLACPTGAMQKRKDGIVFSDEELCIGCQTCAVACPFGIPELNPATGKIAKCDGCMDRVDQGLWPSCALKCPTGSLNFGAPLRVVQDLRVREALRIVRSMQIDATC
jgi:Fe-S-cluster-containing dehydrogenase component